MYMFGLHYLKEYKIDKQIIINYTAALSISTGGRRWLRCQITNYNQC